MKIVIHHNPDCSTSRNVIATIKAAGYKPTIIKYLETGWTRQQLLALYAAAGLTDPSVSDKTLLAAMLEHPILVNRPFVCKSKGVKLCRQNEAVLDLIEPTPMGPLYKEDGALLIDKKGKRVG